MALLSLSLADTATSMSVTGGTAKSYTPDGQQVTNGIHTADNSVTDFRVKPHITWKNRNPSRLADGSYGKGKKDIIVTVPYLDATTQKVYFATARYSFEYSPVVPVATQKNARFLLAQALVVAGTDLFHNTGDIS